MYVGHSGTCGDSGETFAEGITNGADWYPVRGKMRMLQSQIKDHKNLHSRDPIWAVDEPKLDLKSGLFK